MTIERQDILSDFYSGNSKRLRVTVVNSTGTPKDLTGSEITFAMFNNQGVVVLAKSSAVLGEIEIEGNPANGILVVDLLPSDTAHFSGSFRYHVNVVDANGYEETVTSGAINVLPSFAKRRRNTSISAYISGQATT